MPRVVELALTIVGALAAGLALVIAGLLVTGNGHFTFRPPVAQRADFDCGACATYPAAPTVRGPFLVRNDGSVVTLPTPCSGMGQAADPSSPAARECCDAPT